MCYLAIKMKIQSDFIETCTLTGCLKRAQESGIEKVIRYVIKAVIVKSAGFSVCLILTVFYCV